MVGVGVITTEEALAMGASGPILRSTGFPWDLRKGQPYLAYHEVDFDVIYTENGDCFDRYRIRLYEIGGVDQDRAPVCGEDARRRRPRPGQEGDAAPPRADRRVDGGADPSLQAVHRGLPRPRPARPTPQSSHLGGEIGCYLVSDGTGKPVRLHIRGPSFYNLQSMGPMVHDRLVADAVAVISSIDPIMGEVEPMTFTGRERGEGTRADRLLSRAPLGAAAAVAPRVEPGRLGLARRHA